MKPKKPLFNKTSATPEQLQARLGLRRSNAAQPHKNKKAYTRKDKYPMSEE
jgi:hypothetical protein